MFSRRGLFGVFAGLAAAPLVKLPQAEAEGIVMPEWVEHSATARVTQAMQGYAVLDVPGKTIYVGPEVQAFSQMQLQHGDLVHVTWEEPQGASDGDTHEALTLQRVQASDASFPRQGKELCTVKWFNKTRGFGYLKGISSGHQIRINTDCLQRGGIDKAQLGRAYWVHWKLEEQGPIALTIEKA